MSVSVASSDGGVPTRAPIQTMIVSYDKRGGLKKLARSGEMVSDYVLERVFLGDNLSTTWDQFQTPIQSQLNDNGYLAFRCWIKVDGVTKDALALFDPNAKPAKPPVLNYKGKRTIKTKKKRILIRGRSKNARRVEYAINGSTKFRKAKGKGKWSIPLKRNQKIRLLRIRAVGEEETSKAIKIRLRFRRK